MLLQEAGLLPQQLYRESVRNDHHHHGDVEGHQRAKHKERPVVDNALLGTGHDVVLVDDT